MLLSICTSVNPSKIQMEFGRKLKSIGAEHEYRVYNPASKFYKVAKGELALFMGTDYFNEIKSKGYVPKNRTMTSQRGKVFSIEDGGEFMISFSPNIIDVDIAKKPQVMWDIDLAIRYLKTRTLSPKLGTYTYVDDFSAVLQYIDYYYETYNDKCEIALDLETMGLYPWYKDKDIVSVSLTVAEGVADVVYTYGMDAHTLSVVIGTLDNILRSEKVKIVGANLKYDLVWIAEKWGLECTNFTFDTLLAGSMVNENRSNSLNNHAKEYTDIGGYDDCVTPDTYLCTADLKWVKAGDVLPGDELVGFDEFCDSKKRRKLRKSIAVSTKRLVKPCVEVLFSDGARIKCSEDHGFLAHKYKGNGPFDWVHAKDLKVGCRVLVGMPMVDKITDYRSGYLSGLYDGEGYLSYQGLGLVSGISQAQGIVWDKYCQYMTDFGFGGFYSNKKNSDNVMTSKHSGWQTLQLLQKFRPERLINKFGWDGKCIPSGAPKVTVIEVKSVGDIEVVSLETSTHTFIAEGFCSHNSFNEKYDKSKMEKIPKKDLLIYAGGDTDATLRAAAPIKEELRSDKRLLRHYLNIVHPASRAFEKVERRGVYVDIDKFKKLRHDLNVEMSRLETNALGMIPAKIKHKYRDDLTLSKSSLLKEFLFTKNGLNLTPKVLTEKTKEPSTAHDHLMMFIDVPEVSEFVKSLEKWNACKKTLSTYVDGFMKHIRPDGRLHPTYMLFAGSVYGGDKEGGTNTGRTSAKDPAIQTLPKHTEWAYRLRECYVAPPGHLMFQIDFSQGELRIAACLANEQNMIDAYNKGIDLHALTGANLAEITLDEMLALKAAEDPLFKLYRQSAKAANFGLIYGMGANGYREYARASYGLVLSAEEAIKQRDAFFAAYPGLVRWHNTYKNFAYNNYKVYSPLGRIRHLPLIRSSNSAIRSKSERQSVNSPVQSALSDLTLWSMSEIEEHLAHKGVSVVGMTHDSVYGYVPEENGVELVKETALLMENLPIKKVFNWDHQIPFTVDSEIGYSKATLQEI